MWHHVHGFSFHFLLFLLTHPVWDVTPFLYIISINPINFYSHIPCGMWLLGSLFYANDYLFLLTHPVWDVTDISHRNRPHTRNFYSHIPCGMWPPWSDTVSVSLSISTHTSRVGCDQEWLTKEGLLKHFYSHIPCGMWQCLHKSSRSNKAFLLTHPVWDVTSLLAHNLFLRYISTHTSRVGCDEFSMVDIQLFKNFYSHIPCGMWPLYIVYFNHIIPIYYRMDL